MRRAVAAVAIAASVLSAVSACSTTVSGTPGSAGASSGSSVTSSDSPYGLAVERDSRVTYQPDVVVIPNGVSAVRGVGDGGFTWYLDPSAPNVSDLAVGKILFVTGRGVGRVVHLARIGDDVAVTIVPAAITDIIRDGHFAGERPVSLSSPLAYDAGTPFWADPSAPGTGPSSASPSPAHSALGAIAPAAPTLPNPHLGGSSSATIQGMRVTASCCSGGASVRFVFAQSVFRLVGSVTLTMAKPTAEFSLDIDDGKVSEAKLLLAGGFGIKVSFDGATRIFANVDRLIPIPTDFSVPIATVLGVPLSATINQLLNVRTDFHAKDGNISATGEWEIGGGLGFTYTNGHFQVQAPHALLKKQSILDSAQGISEGVNGMNLVYQTRVTVGIGAFGFTAGVYFGFTVNVRLVRGSALGEPITVCNSAQVSLFASYGVGYVIPKPVADVINFFLEKFGSRPIETTGGIGGEIEPFSRIVFDPDTKICRGR